MANLKCTACGYPTLTWAEARTSYGRLIRSGFTAEEAKTASPRCRRCASSILRTDPAPARRQQAGQRRR
jgi:hypothetical protein